MAKETAKTFAFKVDQSSDVPLWVQLRNRIAFLIDTGYYAPGEQLPTVRALASDISINYNTVNKAYLDLKSDGYIEATPGRGAFVRNVPAHTSKDNAHQAVVVVDDCIDACRGLGLTLDEVQLLMNRRVAWAQQKESPSHDKIILMDIRKEKAEQTGA